ncbi:MAG: hypothetical protein IPK76_02665 [Lewinellaceae bacterium]|nr:hypothetical protein [Lewinellaceae bacterium]
MRWTRASPGADQVGRCLESELKTLEVEDLNLAVRQPSGIPYYFFYAQASKNGDFWLAYQLGLVHLAKQGEGWGFQYFPDFDPQLDKNNWQRAYALSPDRQSLYIGTLRGNGLLVYHLKRENQQLCLRQTPRPGGLGRIHGRFVLNLPAVVGSVQIRACCTSTLATVKYNVLPAPGQNLTV